MGNQACLWCHCNLKKKVIYENNYMIERTQELAQTKSYSKEDGYYYKPIFTFIEYEDVTIDMLHLYLRITDKLFDCLIDKIIVSDENDGIDLDQRIALKKFESFLIVNCNITNPLVYSQQKNLKISFRTFDAKERVTIFEKLFEDEKCGFVEVFANYKILEEHNFQVENFVWNEFRIIYNKIKAFDEGELISGENFNMASFKESLKQWLRYYKKLDPMTNTSPYIHAFVFHMPDFLERHGSINLYNCQGLEKLNDFSTKYYHNSTNKHKQNRSFIVQLIKKMNRMEMFNSLDIDGIFELCKTYNLF